MKQALFGFVSSNPIIEIKIDNIEKRKQTTLRDKQNNTFKLPLFKVIILIFIFLFYFIKRVMMILQAKL